ncbi:uncharacterized protein LOC127790837 [Diospyros lotus]|uniref:uncharacterized protein LOC127790837 n=1 Tax=Diospyros lotus TaxID=55363 RepID=UPI0022555F5C|nr:uncharacterized protein LOC127790837 [Diospyros lotus]XP_052176510.1 uncharacterized protein LOC127790837 [Diospyros lotus]
MDPMCREMQPPANQQQRIDLTELKAQIVKKVGPDGSKLYFNYLNMFLNLLMSKVEFNKLCIQILGRENIPLHNHFIRSILKNACSAKVPPAIYGKELLKPVVGVVGNEEPPRDGNSQNMPNPSSLSNGDILPPRKGRAVSHDQEGLDHSNGLGPSGKNRQSLSGYDSTSMENGALTPRIIQRQVQHHQELTAHAGSKADGSTSVHSGCPVSEGRKEATRWSDIEAPLGIPFCPVSAGGARRVKPLLRSTNCFGQLTGGGLLYPRAVRERVKQIARIQGLQGATMECSDVLNNGLDAYLKGLIKSSSQLAGTRSSLEPTKSSMHRHQAHPKLVNGVRLDLHHHAPSSSRLMGSIQETKPYYAISSVDFRAAMEVKPEQLGEDWPSLLEQISWPPFGGGIEHETKMQ